MTNTLNIFQGCVCKLDEESDEADGSESSSSDSSVHPSFYKDIMHSTPLTTRKNSARKIHSAPLIEEEEEEDYVSQPPTVNPPSFNEKSALLKEKPDPSMKNQLFQRKTGFFL